MTILPEVGSGRLVVIGITIGLTLSNIAYAALDNWLVSGALCLCILLLVKLFEFSEIQLWLYDRLAAAAAEDEETAAALRALGNGPNLRVSRGQYDHIVAAHNNRLKARLRTTAIRRT